MWPDLGHVPGLPLVRGPATAFQSLESPPGPGTAEATLTHLFTRRVDLNPEPRVLLTPLDRGRGTGQVF